MKSLKYIVPESSKFKTLDNFIGGKAELMLMFKYGQSAVTTFSFARYIHGFNMRDCIKLMRIQVSLLGKDYPGGLACTQFRGKQNIESVISNW